MGEFVSVARVADLREGRGMEIRFPDVGAELALFRAGNACFAIDNICPHEHTPGLADGLVRDGFVTCPMHGWTFSLETGKTLNGAKGVATHRVRIEGGDVFIEKPDEALPSWSIE